MVRRDQYAGAQLCNGCRKQFPLGTALDIGRQQYRTVFRHDAQHAASIVVADLPDAIAPGCGMQDFEAHIIEDPGLAGLALLQAGFPLTDERTVPALSPAVTEPVPPE